jgi:phosphonopyruvate decarboxylase
MNDSTEFIKAIKDAGVIFATGVPDSLLGGVVDSISSQFGENHLVAANEGGAIGLAIGHYLSSGLPTLVYMQNSGLGNAINPLVSLADPLIYGVPMLLLVGWRGEVYDNGTQIQDEPQHIQQGRITLNQLKLLGIPHFIVSKDISANDVVGEALELTVKSGCPVAIVVRKGSFSSSRTKEDSQDSSLLSREQAVDTIIRSIPTSIPVISTTGMISRELFELRRGGGMGHALDFLTVGGMGHAISIAVGVAINRQDKKVLCLDGDGALLMHMGGLSISATRKNLIHVVLNNRSHDSVGGQPTCATHLNLKSIAKECGYDLVIGASSISELNQAIETALANNFSVFIEVDCKKGARQNLGRPTVSPSENKICFMNAIGDKRDG